MWGVGALVGSLAAGWSIAGFGPDGLPFAMAAVFLVFIVSGIISATRGRRHRA
jgi:predicted branched-subunit amino acid permease